jgi:hypothetical protein
MIISIIYLFSSKFSAGVKRKIYEQLATRQQHFALIVCLCFLDYLFVFTNSQEIRLQNFLVEGDISLYILFFFLLVYRLSIKLTP